jgi:hypothetical protein
VADLIVSRHATLLTARASLCGVLSPLVLIEMGSARRSGLRAPRAAFALFRAPMPNAVIEHARARVAGVAGCGLTLVEADEHAKEVCFATMVGMLAA